MNLFFRMLRVMLAARFGAKTSPLDVHRLHFWVWLGDQDPSAHMTNSRYSSFTDLALLNLVLRSGLMAKIRKAGWMPVIQHESFHYLRMLHFPQRFEVQSQIVGWHEGYICFEHRFLRKGREVCRTHMICRLIGRNKQRVMASDVIDMFNLKLEQPELAQVYQDIIRQIEEIKSSKPAAHS